MDASNKFVVAAMGDKYIIMRPPTGPITADEALVLAAYLVVMVGEDERWAEAQKAVLDA